MSPEDKLQLDVARVLHTMYCHCGKPMSEPPLSTGWLDPAKIVLDTIKEEFDIIPKHGDARTRNLL